MFRRPYVLRPGLWPSPGLTWLGSMPTDSGVFCTKTILISFMSYCTHHHGTVLLLTFLRYSLSLAFRKTFSDVEVNASSWWTCSCLKSTSPELQPYELLKSSHCFHFLGDLVHYLFILLYRESLRQWQDCIY